MLPPYQHLTHYERDRIAILRSHGVSLREMGRRLGRHHTTLARELTRNAPPVHPGYYLPHKAHERAGERNRERHRRARLKSPLCRAYVRRQLAHGWSPELTAGRWNRLHPATPISHEAIYQWVYAEARDLITCLVRRNRRRMRRGYVRGRHHRTHIPSRISITQRPAAVAGRRVVGHWESDTAASRQRRSAALLVAVERKSRYSRIAKLPAREAGAVAAALNRRLSQYPGNLRRSITYDNGSENAQHVRVNAVLGTRSYFCEPYRSWERGTNENTIGLVRRFLPKGTNFATVPPRELRRIERWLNHRPRKCLRYRTPAEVFRDERCT